MTRYIKSILCVMAVLGASSMPLAQIDVPLARPILFSPTGTTVMTTSKAPISPVPTPPRTAPSGSDQHGAPVWLEPGREHATRTGGRPPRPPGRRSPRCCCSRRPADYVTWQRLRRRRTGTRPTATRATGTIRAARAIPSSSLPSRTIIAPMPVGSSRRWPNIGCRAPARSTARIGRNSSSSCPLGPARRLVFRPLLPPGASRR